MGPLGCPLSSSVWCYGSGVRPPALKAWPLCGPFRLSSPQPLWGQCLSEVTIFSQEQKGRTLVHHSRRGTGQRNDLCRGFESRERGGEMRQPLAFFLRPQNSGEGIHPLLPLNHVTHFSLQRRAAASNLVTVPVPGTGECLIGWLLGSPRCWPWTRAGDLTGESARGKSSSLLELTEVSMHSGQGRPETRMGSDGPPWRGHETVFKGEARHLCFQSRRDAPLDSCFQAGILTVSRKSARPCAWALGTRFPCTCRIPVPKIQQNPALPTTVQPLHTFWSRKQPTGKINMALTALS